MSNNTENEDYIDQWSGILSLHRALTPLERLLIVFIVSTFVTCVGCTLLCLTYRRSALIRKYYTKKKLNKEQHCLVNTISRKSFLVTPPPPPPPCYDSIAKTEEIKDFNQLAKNTYLSIARKYSTGTVSDSDGTLSHVGVDHLSGLESENGRSQSVRSSFSNAGTISTISNTYPMVPYARLQVELVFDVPSNLLHIRLTNAEHFPAHPAFGDQAEYFVRVQLSNSKLLKKFQEGWKKRRPSLSLNAWNKQQEATTKNLSRTADDTLICDESVQLPFDKNDLALASLRFLLFATDRSGSQDLMFDSSIPMSPSLLPKHQQMLEFRAVPQVTFGEILMGISYLPTSQRFTVNISKIRYFCKTDKENKTDVRLTITFFYNGRRFFQKRTPFTLNSPNIDNEIKDTITQNIPQNNIQSVYLHLELNSKKNTLISATTILLGEHTRYRSEWQKMLDHPRQTHLGWYQFLG